MVELSDVRTPTAQLVIYLSSRLVVAFRYSQSALEPSNIAEETIDSMGIDNEHRASSWAVY